MARPTARVLAVLEILQSGGTHTAADLAARLGVDERTARRYVTHLVDLDVPVRPVRGRHGGYRIEAGYRMPPLMLTDDEALALVLGLIAADRAGLATTTRDAGERAAAKLRRVLPDRTRRRLDALAAALGVTTPARASTGVDTDVLFTLVEAARERRPVAISYTSRDGRPTARTLEPYGVVAHSGHWYVTGGDSASGQVRTFRLDRLRFPHTLPGHFEAPGGFDATGAILDSLASPATTRAGEAGAHRRRVDPHPAARRAPGLGTGAARRARPAVRHRGPGAASRARRRARPTAPPRRTRLVTHQLSGASSLDGSSVHIQAEADESTPTN